MPAKASGRHKKKKKCRKEKQHGFIGEQDQFDLLKALADKAFTKIDAERSSLGSKLHPHEKKHDDRDCKSFRDSVQREYDVVRGIKHPPIKSQLFELELFKVALSCYKYYIEDKFIDFHKT